MRNLSIHGGRKGGVYFFVEPTKLTAFGGKNARANFEAFLKEQAQAAGKAVAS
jgi:hypothetical protein